MIVTTVLINNTYELGQMRSKTIRKHGGVAWQRMALKWKYTQHMILGTRSKSNTHMRPTVQPLPMCSASDDVLDGVNGDTKLPSVWLQIACTDTYSYWYNTMLRNRWKATLVFHVSQVPLSLPVLWLSQLSQCCNVHRVAPITDAQVVVMLM